MSSSSAISEPGETSKTHEGAVAAWCSSERSAVQPPWLRSAVTLIVVAAHVSVAALLLLTFVEKVTPVQNVSVELMPEGETVTETSVTPTPDAAPVLAESPSMATAPDPQQDADAAAAAARAKEAATQTLEEIAAPLPKVMAPDPIPLPLKSKSLRRSLQSAREARRREKILSEEQEARRAAAQYALKREQAHARQQAAFAQFGAAARRAGVKNGSGHASQMSNSAYAALVAAEINRHKFYPAAARAAGALGSVGVAFSVGPSGAITSHSVTRSSGDSALDAAASQMLAAAHPPPPPGGSFHGATTIHFNFDR